jgi:hypothetical protein
LLFEVVDDVISRYALNEASLKKSTIGYQGANLR